MGIFAIRKEMGLSQQKFAKYFDIPVTNIQHWEQGVSKPPEYVVGLIKRIISLEKSLMVRCSDVKADDK